MASIRDEAVCIRQWDWSETSQTVSVFSRGHGVLRAIAKGARREKGSFSGGLEVATRGEFTGLAKPTSAMVTLTGWDLRETFVGIRRSLPTFYAAMYAVDLVHHAVRDHDPHPDLYDALVRALRVFDGVAEDAGREDAVAAGLVEYQWALLDETGLRPEVGHDVRTGAVLSAAEVHGFSPELGGIVAGRSGEHGAGGGVWRTRPETIEVLRAAASGRPFPTGDPDAVGRAGRLLASYLCDRLGAVPPTVRLLFEDVQTRMAHLRVR